MRRLMLVLLLIPIGLALTGRGAPAATAAPQPAAVTTYRVLPEDERAYENYIHARLEAQLPVVARNLTGWRCVRARPTPPGGEDRPAGAHVWVEAVIRRLGAVDGPPGTYRVTLQAHVQGGASVRSSRELRPDQYHSFLGPAEALGNTAVLLLEELAGQVSPCKAKAKLRGKHKIEQGSLTFERSYSGEAEVALQEDGSFAATMTIPDTWVATLLAPIQCHLTEVGGTCQGPDITCTFSRQPQPVELTLAGRYREADGSLVFTEMRGAGAAGSVSGQCCSQGFCVSQAVDIPGGAGDLLAGSELAVALADGAVLNIPPPVGIPGEWSMSLTLAYGGDGMPAASVVGVTGFPLLTD